MKEINEILRGYTTGRLAVEEANKKLKDTGTGFYLDPEKNVIKPGEEDRFGLLDTGTGYLDKVEVRDGELVNCDVGNMAADLYFGGAVYTVHGRKLVRKG